MSESKQLSADELFLQAVVDAKRTASRAACALQAVAEVRSVYGNACVEHGRLILGLDDVTANDVMDGWDSLRHGRIVGPDEDDDGCTDEGGR